MTPSPHLKMKRKEKEPKTIKWRDSSGVNTMNMEWLFMEDIKRESQVKYDQYVTTVGFIVHETDDFIVSCATVSGEYYSDLCMIPKVLIISIE